MNNERIEEKLMWMNVDPWDSYRWLAEYIIKLEDENNNLKKELDKYIICKDFKSGSLCKLTHGGIAGTTVRSETCGIKPCIGKKD